ncbi:T-cell surface antigen CD2-like [Coregonus clupeaformis]|uniref:T-cell surface antigen CD2-like n=1 Tax=Coregonus clupeaformis TaxID=59861 RepID=UPI001BE00795|nr:T-cell surface antigen CD2-like [Coregonus clupeaformis]
MAVVVLISLILLSLGFAVCLGAEECVYAAVGRNKVIDQDHPGLELLGESFHLRWTHDSIIVYDNRKPTEQKHQTTPNGSLLLNNLQLDNTGTYQVNIYDDMGKLIRSSTTHLCVVSPVSKPRLTQKCTDTSVSLRCDVGNSVDVKVVWSHNRQTLPDHNDTTLTITKAMLKPVDSYVCTVSNKASEEKSDDVNPECADDSSSTVLLFGMKPWLMVVILASGGGLLLILIIITLVCVCQSRRQRARRLEEEEEMRLAPLTQPTRQASLHHHHPPQRSQSQTRPKNRATSQATPNSRHQLRPRPPQPESDDAQPIPMPRRTGPQNHRS